MSAQIKYAYLKGHTWLYRRNYPKGMAEVVGQSAMKQSLRTGDPRVARLRAAEVNARYEAMVEQFRVDAEEALSATEKTNSGSGWSDPSGDVLARLRATLEHSGGPGVEFRRIATRPKLRVSEASQSYLNRRSNELRPGGFKSVRYSVGLFASRYGDQSLCALTRETGKEFLDLISRLSPVIGKSETTRGLTLDQLVAFSAHGTARITTRTQKRIWAQVNHFLDWAVYEGQLEQNPFRTVLFDRRIKPQPYAVPTDEEVVRLMAGGDETLRPVLLTCLLTGMRAGEAAGLLREDVTGKGSLGNFIQVRPNEIRLLKTDAAEREVPVHPVLDELISGLPSAGPLFPELSVNEVTKRFAVLRRRCGVERPGLVFHSTRKWFITQCERTGVPEHFTASLVGHKSARSENGITYGIYSAGISDEQKRGIVDQIRLPPGVSP